MVLATVENAKRLGKKACFSPPIGKEREGKMPLIYIEDKNVQTWIQVKLKAGYPGVVCLYVNRAFVVFGILHIATLKDHSLESLSFQLEVFVILIKNSISFVADF